MTIILRTVGIAIAVAAVIDPAISVRRSQPIALELASSATAGAERIRQRLLLELGEDVTGARAGGVDAVVVIDGPIEPTSIRDDVTVSAVKMTAAPNVRLVTAAPVSKAVAGHQVVVAVDADVQNVAGRKTPVTVTQQGAPVGRIEHVWTEAPRQRIFVPIVAVGDSTHAVRVSAAPFADEGRVDDNAVDTAIVSVGRPLQVAFIEPRPSWAAGFVRRAVESDPAFEISSVITASRGVEVRTGSPPASLTAQALGRFDAIVVGAPEELKARDLEAMRSFLASRGGTAILLPDRRPSGPYATFITAAGFDEVLLNTPVTVVGAGGERALRTSELAVPRTAGPAMRALASLADGRAAIAAWPVGSGTLIFSGALDAWRYRADADGGFARFWRASIAAAALTAPPAVRVEIDPPVVGPGSPTRVLAHVRPTEFQHEVDGGITLPMLTASATPLTGNDIAAEPVRMWPASELGLFEGQFVPSRKGSYRIDVTAGRAHDSVLGLGVPTSAAAGADDEESALVASVTGGVVAAADDLSPIVTHLRSIPRRDVPATVYPMRSAWWTLPFALALCGEWALRRRRGER